MEVADQWRREWAGTAEYGKVVEGGVTRRVARAMEVLHASGPGAKVRVMRAAYHTTAGPGVPASSYMMHASRRVFSSGFNFLEQPASLPSRPLEISSTPLESSPELFTDTENYKVTEPDDIEISEPSKWKSSKSGNIRMPSEESSSTDNTSIIDLDLKASHRNTLRKYSYDSENSDIVHSGRSSRVSPLLDAPVTLSTLKFKSLLNGSNEWNSRRKSYSFEDTSPLAESITLANDALAMESSTDSGICKSSEIVNDHIDENRSQFFDTKERELNKDDSFQSWLSKNRQHNNYYKGAKFKSYREHEVVTEDPAENNITLQSTGKVSIALPVKVETDDGYHYQKNDISEDGQRKIKKVEFCKTELHFAVDTGKVNIIATDEKPPPTNNFRKKRSAFVPMHEMIDKPITLFGEKNNDFSDINHRIDTLKHAINEFNESDENTAATKSILKNRIPKPKPYLLGENMTFGSEDIEKDSKVNDASYVLTAVSLINRQLQSEKRSGDELTPGFLYDDAMVVKNNAFGAIKQGPSRKSLITDDTHGFEKGKSQKFVKIHEDHDAVSSVKNIHYVKRSPTPGRVKSRELRDSDLTYFGINQSNSIKNDNNRLESLDDSASDDFQSVKLIRQVSNSVCNSETEDNPEYMNIPLNTIYAPVPTPRIRSKFDDKPNQVDEIRVLKPVLEQVKKINNDDSVTRRRSRFRKQEEMSFSINRSLSEPRKTHKYNSTEKARRLTTETQRCSRGEVIKENEDIFTTALSNITKDKMLSEDELPIYINLTKLEDNSSRQRNSKIHIISSKTTQQENRSKKDSSTHKSRKLETPPSSLERSTDKVLSKKVFKTTEDSDMHENKSQGLKKGSGVHSNKTNNKLQHSDHSLQRSKPAICDTNISKTSAETKNSYKYYLSNKDKPQHRSRSTQRQSTKDLKDTPVKESASHYEKDCLERKSAGESETNSDVKLRKRQSSKDKTSSRAETVKIIPKIENSTVNKATTSRDKSRPSSRSRKSEYVINYDDKNGTVSSVRKVGSGSNSPGRKKTSKDVIKEKFRENLKSKPSDKAALLQLEDHQRNVDTMNDEKKRRRKMHIQRSCQVL